MLKKKKDNPNFYAVLRRKQDHLYNVLLLYSEKYTTIRKLGQLACFERFLEERFEKVVMLAVAIHTRNIIINVF
jgi:hypothetical protein